MLDVLRNMARRKVRTGLTLFGIVIGIFALTVMGSMTEYFNSLLDNASRQAGSDIVITPKGGLRAVLSEADLRKIERVPGVRAVVPSVTASLNDLGVISFGPPDSVIGIPPEQAPLRFRTTSLNRGRILQRGDTYHAVIGSKIARTKKVDLGDTLTWREQGFSVVGILNETQTAPDGWVVIPLDIERKILKRPNLITQMNVVPEDVREGDALAERIKASVDTVQVQTLQQQLDQIRQGLAVFNAILLGSAVLAAVIGGLAVINTMVMSVSERTPEIGLKKALGASDGDVVREFLLEATTIGLIGGVLGLAFGAGLANLLNAATLESLGSSIFTVTPRLAAVALGFAVILGAGAGLYPAWSAARLDPVKALRGE